MRITTTVTRCQTCSNQGKHVAATQWRRYEMVGQDSDLYIPYCDAHADHRAPFVPLAEVVA